MMKDSDDVENLWAFYEVSKMICQKMIISLFEVAKATHYTKVTKKKSKKNST